MTEAPRPGRPRSAEVDEAIVEAALDLFAEDGFEGLTMEAVATRAGVGKASLYRRYPCKTELIIDAASRLTEAAQLGADTGSLAGDLRACARGLVRVLTGTVAGRCASQLIAAVARCPELGVEHARLVTARRLPVRGAVARAVERGEVAPTVDVELVADLLAGPIFYRHLVSQARLDVRYADRVVDGVLEWLGVGTATGSEVATAR